MGLWEFIHHKEHKEDTKITKLSDFCAFFMPFVMN